MKEPQPFSFVRLVFFALGAGVLVLLVSIPIILGVAVWSPLAGLIVAILAVIGVIAAIGVVSQRMVGQAEQALKREIEQQEQERNNNGG